MCEVPVPGDDRGIELVADRYDQRVYPREEQPLWPNFVCDLRSGDRSSFVDGMYLAPREVFASALNIAARAIALSEKGLRVRRAREDVRLAVVRLEVLTGRLDAIEVVDSGTLRRESSCVVAPAAYALF